MLARRLEKYLPFVSDPDQNGFVRGRQAFHCVCRVLNIVYAKTEHPDTAVLSLDAEKVLKRFGFGIISLTGLKSVLTNDIISNISGYKINESKSAILFLKHSERIKPPVQTPFKVIRDSVTYLGIRITPKVEDLVETNYNPVIESISESINRWSMLPISIIGRINILKMNVLPKFLYLFHSIPLSSPINFLFF